MKQQRTHWQPPKPCRTRCRGRRDAARSDGLCPDCSGSHTHSAHYQRRGWRDAHRAIAEARAALAELEAALPTDERTPGGHRAWLLIDSATANIREAKLPEEDELP